MYEQNIDNSKNYMKIWREFKNRIIKKITSYTNDNDVSE